MRRDQKALSAAMAALRADIAALGEQVNAIGRVGAEEHGAFFDLARRIDALAADKPLDRNLLAAIRADLETLRAMVDGSARQSTLGDIEERHDGIAAQINDLLTGRRTAPASRRSARKSPRSAARSKPTTARAPSQRLEMRVAELGRAIEAALSARQAPPQPTRRWSGWRPLQDIAGRIDGLARQRSQAAAIATAEQRLRRDALDDIASRLGGLVDTTAHSVAIEAAQRQLEGRLEEIVDRLGGMLDDAPQQAALEHAARAAAGDHRADRRASAPRSASRGGARRDQGARSARCAPRSPAGRADAARAPSISRRRSAISPRSSRPSTSRRRDEGKALADLEAQVAHLASELEQTKPRAAALARSRRASTACRRCSPTRRAESIAGARAEARKAVSELSEMVAGNEIDSEPRPRPDARPRQPQERRRQHATRATRSKLESVSETLAQVVDRLSRLESEANERRGARPPPTAPKRPPAPVVPPAPGPRASRRQPADPPRSRPPEADPAGTQTRRRRSRRPRRRPPTGAPTSSPPPGARRRPPRREVAAGEMSPPHETRRQRKTARPTGATSERKPGAFARISQAIRNRKRPLLLAAAAIVLAIGAMQVYGKLSTRPRGGVARSRPPMRSPNRPPRSSATWSRPPAPLPTVPRVAEPALVAPAATPDAAIAFAEPEAFDEPLRRQPERAEASGFGRRRSGG